MVPRASLKPSFKPSLQHTQKTGAGRTGLNPKLGLGPSALATERGILAQFTGKKMLRVSRTGFNNRNETYICNFYITCNHGIRACPK